MLVNEHARLCLKLTGWEVMTEFYHRKAIIIALFYNFRTRSSPRPCELSTVELQFNLFFNPFAKVYFVFARVRISCSALSKWILKKSGY